MRKSVRYVPAVALAVLMLIAIGAWGGTTKNADLVEIEKVAGYYLNSGKTGDIDLLRKAFHPSLRLQCTRKGVYTEWSGADYISWQKPGKKSDYRTRILSIDCAGDAAIVKAEMDFGNEKYVDYLSFLRIEGRWWIVNKIFYEEARSQEG
jgi:Putative lumazine-binding